MVRHCGRIQFWFAWLLAAFQLVESWLIEFLIDIRARGISQNAFARIIHRCLMQESECRDVTRSVSEGEL